MRHKLFTGIEKRGVVKDPYFPVYKEELKLNNGKATGIYAIFSDKALFETVSKQYVLLPHQEASQIATNMLEKCNIKYEIDKSVATNYGAKFFQIIKFPGYKFTVDTVDNTALDGKKYSDDFIPTVILKNSYDKTCAFQFIYGCFRFVCMNGMVVGSVIQDVSYRHTKEIQPEQIGKVFKMKLEETIENVKGGYERLNSEEASPYIKLLLAEIFTKNMIGEVIKFLPDSSFDYDGEKNFEVSPDISAYVMYNIVTNVITHKVKSMNRQVELGNKVSRIFNI